MEKISLVIKNTLNELKDTMQNAVAQLVKRVDGNYVKLAEIKNDMVECYQELDEIIFAVEDFGDDLCDLAEDCDCVLADLDLTLNSPMIDEEDEEEEDYDDMVEEDEIAEEEPTLVVEDEDGNEEEIVVEN
jgi:hypothetical protein